VSTVAIISGSADLRTRADHGSWQPQHEWQAMAEEHLLRLTAIRMCSDL
jgi:hypothetical protein